MSNMELDTPTQLARMLWMPSAESHAARRSRSKGAVATRTFASPIVARFSARNFFLILLRIDFAMLRSYREGNVEESQTRVNFRTNLNAQSAETDNDTDYNRVAQI